ncbi:MAG: Ser-Thr-rich GPI-anchored membrane family protein [Promethearchaeota archaeon]
MYSVISRKRMIISTIVFFFIITNPIITVILDINLGNDIVNKKLLKLSNSDIAIITPENKTYIESMSGYYPATFGFENDEDHSDPNGWIIFNENPEAEVISKLYGHNKVLRFYDTVSASIIIPDNSCSWEVDSPQNISWNSTGAISDVKLELYKEDVLVMEIVSETSNDGFYSWNISSILEGSTHYQIKISDVSNSSIYDYTEYFEIYTPIIDSLTVTTPDILTIWETGTSQDITWTSTGTISYVKIELYENDEFVMDITTSTINDGSYMWAISPDLEEGIDYQIKISNVFDPITYDFSDYFEIKKPTSEGLTDIPGYDLYLLIIIISIISVILFRNRFKKLK